MQRKKESSGAGWFEVRTQVTLPYSACLREVGMTVPGVTLRGPPVCRCTVCLSVCLSHLAQSREACEALHQSVRCSSPSTHLLPGVSTLSYSMQQQQQTQQRTGKKGRRHVHRQLPQASQTQAAKEKKKGPGFSVFSPHVRSFVRSHARKTYHHVSEQCRRHGVTCTVWL